MIRKENIISNKGGMSYLQILILVVSSFAIAYLIYESGNVKAQSLEDYSCCEKTINGNYCQFVKDEQCDDDYRKVPTQCEYVDYCKFGCCFSKETGLCSENSPQRSCQEGRWKDDAACNIAECQRGCCVLGRSVIFTTQRNCQIEAGFLSLTADFRQDIKTEVECIFLVEKDDEGACVYEEEFTRTCKFTTREGCKITGRDFYKNVFCSAPALETNCLAHERKACMEGEDSVYWFDSCGNREEIAEECSIFAGTICGQVGGDYECKSVNCEVEINGNIVEKKNGESWCEYDGTIGEGKDIVGSRHWKHICFMGEEKVEPCEDYRNQICVQSDTELENGETFSEAACRINNWRSCLEYNTQEKSKDKDVLAEKCNENPDCFVKHVEAADKFKFDFCAPEYPPGFDLTNENGGKNAETICSMATQKCTVIYVKTLSGWKCEYNCECEKEGFTQKMNDFCTSLGDCGAYVNIAGEVTDDGYSIKGSSKLKQAYLDTLKQYAKPNPNQEPAEPGNLSFFGKLGMPIQTDYETSEGGDFGKIGMGISGVAFALQVASVHIEYPSLGIKGAISSVTTQGGVTTAESAGSLPTNLGAIGNALAAVGASLAVSNLLSMAFGFKGEAAQIMFIAAIAVGAYVAIAYWGTGLTLFQILGKVFWPLLVVAIVLKLLGIGKTKKKIVTFTCLPWQPPTEGNCEKCNDNEKPCSQYRCKSLGQTCELINQGTEQELCVDNFPLDVSSPKISPLLGAITENYQYDNIKDNGFEISDLDGNCIPEFTNVLFGIKTDKASQCKISDNPLASYDEMEDFFGGNLYLTNHTMILNLPSPESLKNQYNLTDEEIKKIGEIKFYVKCKSLNGKTNDAAYTIKTCVKPGPDLTAPYITKLQPENNAYIAYNTDKQVLNLWTNEPSNCKYSISNNQIEDMENSIECLTDIEDQELWGWPCNTTLTDLNENNKFYIRCRDISDNNNTMAPYVYELKKSEFELSIEQIKPADGEEITARTEPMTLTLEVITSKGAENGKAECSFRFGETGSYIRFLNTFSNTHSQIFSSIIRGKYKIYAKCVDAAGNKAEDSVEFNVKIDTSAPKITRVYYSRGLILTTNENSICAYSFTDERCKFEIENATQAELMSGEGKEHTGEWQTENNYYIKCKDEYGNEPGKCNIIIRPYELM